MVLVTACGGNDNKTPDTPSGTSSKVTLAFISTLSSSTSSTGATNLDNPGSAGISSKLSGTMTNSSTSLISASSLPTSSTNTTTLKSSFQTSSLMSLSSSQSKMFSSFPASFARSSASPVSSFPRATSSSRSSSSSIEDGFVNNYIKIDVSSSGTNLWSLQLASPLSKGVEAGKTYKISARLKASAPTDVHLYVTPGLEHDWATYPKNTDVNSDVAKLNLTTDWKTYELTFVADITDLTNRLHLDYGFNAGYQLFVDNLSVKEVGTDEEQIYHGNVSYDDQIITGGAGLDQLTFGYWYDVKNPGGGGATLTIESEPIVTSSSSSVSSSNSSRATSSASSNSSK
jgi:hypothetical protein